MRSLAALQRNRENNPMHSNDGRSLVLDGAESVGNAIHFLPDSSDTDNPSPWEND